MVVLEYQFLSPNDNFDMVYLSYGHPEYRCDRKVSTVICFHEVQCLEPSCNHHGICTNGHCNCSSPWIGEDCGQLNCTIEKCSGHGNCSNGMNRNKQMSTVMGVHY